MKFRNRKFNKIIRSSFKELKEELSKLFQQKVNIWLEKLYSKNVIAHSWKSFISCYSPSACKMYGHIKTRKINDTVRIITSATGLEPTTTNEHSPI